MSIKMTGRVQQGSNQLPDYSLKGPVKYIFEEADCNNRLKHIKKGPIGFDTEFYGTPTRTPIYVPGKYNLEHGKLCVIQVAVEGQVYVIHIKRMRAIPAELIRILKSVDIVKVGVDFANDGKVLYELFGIPMNNFKDVGLMVKYANAHKYPDKDQGPLSMEQCVQDILHAHLDKALQTSDWRAHELSNEQIKYAALDAQAALEVFKIAQHSLQRRGHILKINIPSFWYSHDIRAGFRTMRQKLPHLNQIATWTKQLLEKLTQVAILPFQCRPGLVSTFTSCDSIIFAAHTEGTKAWILQSPPSWGIYYEPLDREK
ncbi:ribonuclease H-like domain-containing protein [Mycena galopus ATCC 62051]|nr:ribonuclease H-like domain-containing protein [Mycena galopus ATCC 62051]